MKFFAMFLAIAIAAVAAVPASQEAASKSPSPTPVAEPAKPVTASGEIVRYDAGKTIVLKQPDARVVTYALAPALTIPAEVQVGRRVTIFAEAGADGVVRVTRVTLLAPDAVPPAGQPPTTAYTREAGKPVEQKTVTVTGDVVRYEAGKTIVVRSPDGREVTYTIARGTPPPGEVSPGRRVSIVTESSDSGPVLVTRITTETVGADGQTKTTTEKTEVAPSGAEAKTQITSVYGTVTAYEPGSSLTILLPNRTTVTYTIDSASVLPEGLAAGRKVVVRTITRPGGKPIVRKVTYSATSTTRKKKTAS